MIARLVLFVALIAAVGVQGDVNITLDIPTTADPILQSVVSGVQNVQPATQKVASSLLGKYQQTLQDIIAQFTNSANAVGQLNNQVSQEAADTTAQIVGSAESDISAAVNTANTIVNQTAASDLPVIGQVANGVSYLQNELGSAINTFKNIYETFEDEFCTAAYYTPPTDVPANLTGPGFSLTFSLGNCTFDPDQLLTPDGALECFGPSVSLQQTPLTFTSAYKQAASFTGEVCVAQKNFGQPVTKILHVFDPKVDAQNHEPISSLAKYLEKQLGELLPMLGVKPISGFPKVSSSLGNPTSPTSGVSGVSGTSGTLSTSASSTSAATKPAASTSAAGGAPLLPGMRTVTVPSLPSPVTASSPATQSPATSTSSASPTIVKVAAPSGSLTAPTKVLTSPGSVSTPMVVARAPGIEVIREPAESSPAAGSSPGTAVAAVPTGAPAVVEGFPVFSTPAIMPAVKPATTAGGK